MPAYCLLCASMGLHHCALPAGRLVCACQACMLVGKGCRISSVRCISQCRCMCLQYCPFRLLLCCCLFLPVLAHDACMCCQLLTACSTLLSRLYCGGSCWYIYSVLLLCDPAYCQDQMSSLQQFVGLVLSLSARRMAIVGLHGFLTG